MSFFRKIFASTLGKKYLMAISGVALFLFIIGHLLGNLQIFLPDNGAALNRYAAFLQSNKEILWPSRIGLLAFVAIHIWTSISLTLENRAARKAGYEVKELVSASYASRTMMISGFIIAAFVIYHLLHFTVQVKEVNLTGQDFVGLHDEEGRHDVYRMMIVGFSNVWVSGFYVLGMALLCLHLSHGTSAMFQSVGLKNEGNGVLIDRFAKIVAAAIFVGYASIPVAVLTGLVK